MAVQQDEALGSRWPRISTTGSRLRNQPSSNLVMIVARPALSASAISASPSALLTATAGMATGLWERIVEIGGAP